MQFIDVCRDIINTKNEGAYCCLALSRMPYQLGEINPNEMERVCASSVINQMQKLELSTCKKEYAEMVVRGLMAQPIVSVCEHYTKEMFETMRSVEAEKKTIHDIDSLFGYDDVWVEAYHFMRYFGDYYGMWEDAVERCRDFGLTLHDTTLCVKTKTEDGGFRYQKAFGNMLVATKNDAITLFYRNACRDKRRSIGYDDHGVNIEVIPNEEDNSEAVKCELIAKMVMTNPSSIKRFIL